MTFEEEFPGLSKACNVGTPGESLIDVDKWNIMNTCIDKQMIKKLGKGTILFRLPKDNDFEKVKFFADSIKPFLDKGQKALILIDDVKVEELSDEEMEFNGWLKKEKVKEILDKKITCRCGSRDCIDCQETIEAEDIMEKLGLDKEGDDKNVKS